MQEYYLMLLLIFPTYGWKPAIEDYLHGNECCSLWEGRKQIPVVLLFKSQCLEGNMETNQTCTVGIAVFPSDTSIIYNFS